LAALFVTSATMPSGRSSAYPRPTDQSDTLTADRSWAARRQDAGRSSRVDGKVSAAPSSGIGGRWVIEGPRREGLPEGILARVLPVAGLFYVGLGVVFLLAYWVGGVRSSLLPTGWIFPLVLLVTGALMTARRRFDIVATLWAGLTAVVFALELMIYTNVLLSGFQNPAAFDATVIVSVFGLVALILRPQFRRERSRQGR